MWQELWQGLAAGIIVALAVLYAGAKYLPGGWRRAIVHRLSQGGRRSTLVKWLDTSASCGSGCNSCNTCGPATPVPPTGQGKGKVIKIHERR
ncbi:DUF6587 family protein [Massilia sp. MS-15]|uniref:DUF6587 family protein n=1 Tax=Massilia sp. MS-15 TaxID=2878200 RepID=UPI001CD3DEF5|nr:DUF6587 family protein [Massilia sp. MS-15]MCA1248155.1 hypothetical protein [Massilia sp. MS-15]